VNTAEELSQQHIHSTTGTDDTPATTTSTAAAAADTTSGHSSEQTLQPSAATDPYKASVLLSRLRALDDTSGTVASIHDDYSYELCLCLAAFVL
jgi:hypothetical protein